ncbi:hypothetical protein [Nesterenkonia sphaerica]|uniref:Type II toxin-antitoxin system HicB family antitoxin n=1 Tax=Nesterenkonia sphaerica TaxID=1804988 RepID=A0A5R9AMT7_9MICC|nr:hypothetical protein [Nesterenkonia sphaerica]TLP79947.1 hypothetical protein FEF27_00745 [Nesterenkonia sphaerica]
MNKEVYIATATKSGKYWHIHVPQLDAVTQARSLDEAEDMIRDLITIYTGEDPQSVEISLEMDLPKEVKTARRRAAELREKAAKYNGDAARYSRQSVALLRQNGYTHKEIAVALGISRQRAAQLSAEAQKGGAVIAGPRNAGALVRARKSGRSATRKDGTRSRASL